MTPTLVLASIGIFLAGIVLFVVINVLKSRSRARFERRRLNGLLFIALAGLLAWGATVDPAKAALRWVFAAVFACWGIVDLFFDQVRWLRDLDRVERVYLQMITLGLAVGAVAWLIPASGSDALLAVGGLLVLLPLGLWIRLWYVRRQAKQ